MALPAPVQKPSDVQHKLKTEFQAAAQSIKASAEQLDLGIDFLDFNDVISRIDDALSLDQYKVRTYPLSDVKKELLLLESSFGQVAAAQRLMKDPSEEQKENLEKAKSPLEASFNKMIVSLNSAVNESISSLTDGADTDQKVLALFQVAKKFPQRPLV